MTPKTKTPKKQKVGCWIGDLVKTRKNTKIKHQNKQTSEQKTDNSHFPVLLEQVLTQLDPQAGDHYLDLTAGYGGHARKILERTLQASQASLVDRDQEAISALKSQPELAGAEIIHKDFLTAAQELLAKGRRYEVILADLGVSSPHLNNASRGFSIRLEGPLDMRMDGSQELTAKTIVNTYEEAELEKLLREYGEEPKARAIARLIAANRPFATTRELAATVAKAWPGHSRVHPATRTFQALRIAVNDELGLLKQAMPVWLELLAPGGRIAIISFHSLEDRLVKELFREHAGDRYDAPLRLLTKKPVSAEHSEIVSNPRSRSAKLRAAVKINIKKGRGSNADTG